MRGVGIQLLMSESVVLVNIAGYIKYHQNSFSKIRFI